MILPDRQYPQLGITSKGDFWVDVEVGESVTRPWDTLRLGNLQLPGLWQIEASTEIQYDTPQQQTNVGDATAPPQYKIVIHDRGYKPAVMRAVGAIWTLDDWNLLRKKLPQISPKADTQLITRNAWDISHPAAALLGVGQVLINSVRVRPPINQTLYIEIGMIQYFINAETFDVHSSGAAFDAKAAGATKPVATP